MNKLILLAFSLIALTARAQTTVSQIELHDNPPLSFQQILLDHVEQFSSHLITLGEDQYFGQTNAEGNLYGFGRYLRKDGTQLFGVFRDSQLLLGVTIGKEAALVGGTEFYSSYSPSSGQLQFVYQAQERKLYDTSLLSDQQFLSLLYQNGDTYIGETKGGKREGLGVYYYANGDVWFGQYKAGERCGMGAIFTRENKLVIGIWQGDKSLRLIEVRQGK